MNNNTPNEFDNELLTLFQRTEPKQVPVDINALLETSPSTDCSEHNLARRRWKLTFRATIFVTAAASVALLLSLPIPSPEGFAFAQVQQQVEKVRTVDYIERTIELDDDKELPDTVIDTRFGPNGNAQTAMKAEIASLEEQLTAVESDKQDIELRLGLMRPYLDADPDSVPTDIRRVRIKGKHLQRTDHFFPYGEFHGVTNAKTGESVSFDHQRQTKETFRTQVVIDGETGQRSEHQIEISPAVDFFKEFRSIPAQQAERLAKQKVDGRDAIGFRSTERERNGVWTQTYWVDPASKLPVKVVVDFRAARDRVGSIRWVKDHFVFDRPLKDELFSTDTPKGYEAKDGKILGIQY